MIRSLATATFALVTVFAHAQTLFRITNVTITEKGVVQNGTNATAEMKNAEGTDHVVLFADQTCTVRSRVKVSTANVRRSSLKNSAVNAIFEIDLVCDGKKDNRRVEKIFYGEQERTAHFKEVFTIKSGIAVRTITVEFDGSLE